MVEEGRSRLQRHSLLARIDQIPVFLTRRRRFAKIKNAVFGVEDRLAAFRLIAGNHFGKTDPKVHIGAVGNILRRAPGNLGIGKLDVFKRIDGHM